MGETTPTPEAWEAIEDLFRAGQLSIREIARQFGITDGAIRKKAKDLGWARDLTKKVQQAVRTELVRSAVRTSSAGEPEIINAAMSLGVEVVRGHRKDLSSGRSRTERLAAQLDRLAKQIENMQDGDTNFLGALSAAASINEALGRTIAKIIPLERKAFNLDDETAIPHKTHEERLAELD